MSDLSFQELGLPENLLQAVMGLGFENPSAIQAAAIPAAMTGEDIVGLSQTGSGKTAAFALPVLAKIDLSDASPQALIVCPTRELANQVCEEVHSLAKHLDGFRAIPVYGGAPIDRQFRQLSKGVHVIVGTPGRLQDHLRRGTFDPKKVRTVILDEADRMLDMGFREEMEELLSEMPEDRQTLFFSATMNKGVGGLIRKFGKEPRTIEIERKTLTVEAIEQVSYEVRNRSRVEVLSRLLDMDEPRLAVVFCNTRRVVDEVCETLNARGYSADKLHGDISQDQRERTLRSFRKGTVEILVATDVAARGIDIDEIDLVANYDLPQDPEDYVHRIGRTGRAGRKGRAVTFVYGRDIYRLQNIERYTKQRIPRARIPSLEEVEGKFADQLFEGVREKLEAGEWKDFSGQLDRLLDQGHTATDVASVLFDMLAESKGREGEEIAEDRPGFKQREPRDGGGEMGGDRRERREREPRRDREFKGGAEEGMTRLFLNMGKLVNLQPKDIAGLLYNEANLPRGAVGRIHMFPKHCLIEVRSDVAEEAIAVSKEAKLRGKPFRLDFDRNTGAPGGIDGGRPGKKPYRGQGKRR
ncbi:DEAD/DEAH box helicase [Roseibacillus ishigakijimensis]|uniref:DEAD/DEAH box helicase n=1 Tax=Roseibacillus ishigakijimensis TaxID=454146 RepID=A0A934RSN1_9BACT|nr:DEAD/DEAH box helicase [Roseibacillus ishigakijimensis]MBK1833781.1 DEAD/DEAH box helicase [Roseibacillus ishigakijimensis]